MAKEDVNIKVSANVAEAVRMWQAMEEGPKGMASELEQLGRKGKKASSGMSKEFSSLVGHWVSIGAGIAAAKKLIDLFISAQKESLRLTGEATIPVDDLSRRFQVQGGLTNAEAERAKVSILATGRDRAFTPEGAFGPGTQLVSSGFTPQEVTGGALDEFLKLLNATNANGGNVDAAELAKATVQFLKATEQTLTADSIRGNAQEIQGLFKSTNLQAGGLGLFAGKAGPISDVTGLKKELLPIFSQFLDVVSDEVGGTAFRSSSIALATAGSEPAKVRALKSIGLKPEDIDFQGEDFFTVQKRMADAFDSKPGEVANIAAKRLFGNEGLIAKSVLFSQSGVAETQRRLGLSASDAAYERDVAITEGSLLAKGRAAESGKASAFFDETFVDPATARQVLLSKLQEAGVGAFAQGVSAQYFDTVTYWGGDAESAVHGALAPISVPGGDRRFAADVIKESSATQAADLNITVTLQDQNANAIPIESDVNLQSEQ